MPSLLVTGGPLSGHELVVESQLVLGRGDADIVIDDPEISRRHALMSTRDGAIEIEDLDSLNGTWVNEHRIESAVRLAPGDVIRLGPDDHGGRRRRAVPRPSTSPNRSSRPSRRRRLSSPRRPSAGPPSSRSRLDDVRSATRRSPSQARFCSYCGVVHHAPSGRTRPPRSPLVPTRSRRAGGADELRPVTALFADIVGSTALGERLTPHEVKALIGECVSRMARAIEQYGGSIDAYMGDGIAAFFGMPAAHEDDPERAAHAAIRILEVVAEYARDVAAAWGVEDFNVRVGINSGQTAVGLVGGAEQHVVALGDVTNVAARLQSAAAPGTVVVGGSTARRLAHRFVLESLGELNIKGREQPVAAWRLVRVQEASQEPAPTPLVDREAEVGRLRAGLDELLEGRGQVLLLMGETGIGKTRMLSELRTIAGGRAVWLEGHCRSYGSEILYGPLVDVLRRWLHVESGEAEVSVRTKLRAKLAGLATLDAAEVVRPLGRLLGFRDDEDRRDERAGGARARAPRRLHRLARRADRDAARRARARRAALGRSRDARAGGGAARGDRSGPAPARSCLPGRRAVRRLTLPAPRARALPAPDGRAPARAAAERCVRGAARDADARKGSTTPRGRSSSSAPRATPSTSRSSCGR